MQQLWATGMLCQLPGANLDRECWGRWAEEGSHKSGRDESRVTASRKCPDFGTAQVMYRPLVRRGINKELHHEGKSRTCRMI